MPDSVDGVSGPPACPVLDATGRRRRAALLRRIHRTYQTRVVRLDLGPLALDFVRVADPDVVLDMVAEEEGRIHRLTGRSPAADQLHLPYWAELWDSAPALAQFLARHWTTLGPGAAAPPRSVLDLGCGMGLSGTVAAALGARVLFADLETPALLFAELNSLPWRSRVRLRKVNWQAQDLEERFDLVLGADIIYERAQWQYLEPFFRRHVGGRGRVLLGEPGRPAGEAFPAWAASRGWSVERFDERLAGREQPIHILSLANRSGRTTDAPW